MAEPLTPYEIARQAIPLLPEDSLVPVPDLREHLRCMICYEIIREAKAVFECLHRFCKGCAEEAVRKASAAKTMKRSGAECPLCRKNIASKRDLYDDPHFQSLVAVIYPHVEAIERAEQQQLEEKTKQYEQAREKRRGLHHNQHQQAAVPHDQQGGAAAATAAAAAAPSLSTSVPSSPVPSVAFINNRSHAPEAEIKAQFRVCFGLLPLPLQDETLAGEQLPSLGRRLIRTSAATKVASIKRLVAKRLLLDEPNHLELSVRLGSTGQQVVLDDALTLEDVVLHFWEDVTRELVLHYALRRQDQQRSLAARLLGSEPNADG